MICRQPRAAVKASRNGPQTTPYRGERDYKSLVAFVRASNEHRRQLSIGQRGVIAFKLTKLAKTKFRLSTENEKTDGEKPAISQAEADQSQD